MNDQSNKKDYDGPLYAPWDKVVKGKKNHSSGDTGATIVDWDLPKHEKRKDAFNLFYESVLKPDDRLRSCAHNQECFNELMEWRSDIIKYLNQRRNEEFN
jgi:hypothetical protein